MSMRAPISALALSAMMAPAVAGAQTNLVFVPSISVSALSDDNVFTTVHRAADQTTLITPAAEGLFGTPRLSLLGAYAFDMLRSADFSSLNDLEARRHGRADAIYHQTSRLTFEVDSHYDRSDEAGELNFETGFLLPRTRATRWEVGPSFTYKATPVMTVLGTYGWIQEGLEDVMVQDEHVGRLLITRQLSDRASLTGGYIGRRFVNGLDTQTSNAAVGGAAYQLGPFTMFSVQAGPRLSSRGGVEPEVIASLVRRSPTLFGYAIDYWSGQSIILGVLGPVEVKSATARAAWPVRRNIEIGGATGYFRSESEIQGQARVYHVEAVAAWTLQPFYTISASYGADFQHGDIRTSFLNEQDVVRHVFQVRLTVAPRLSRTIQQPGPLVPLAGEPRGVHRD
jgi:hypothetical protein